MFSFLPGLISKIAGSGVLGKIGDVAGGVLKDALGGKIGSLGELGTSALKNIGQAIAPASSPVGNTSFMGGGGLSPNAADRGSVFSYGNNAADHQTMAAEDDGEVSHTNGHFLPDAYEERADLTGEDIWVGKDETEEVVEPDEEMLVTKIRRKKQPIKVMKSLKY